VIRAKSAYEPLLLHFADLTTSQYTMSHLTGERRPTTAESRLIDSYVDETSPCRTNFINAMTAVSPTLGIVISQELSKVEDVDVLLAKTWGNAAAQNKQIVEACPGTAKGNAELTSPLSPLTQNLIRRLIYRQVVRFLEACYETLTLGRGGESQ
jgi:hypothetical protein